MKWTTRRTTLAYKNETCLVQPVLTACCSDITGRKFIYAENGDSGTCPLVFALPISFRCAQL